MNSKIDINISFSLTDDMIANFSEADILNMIADQLHQNQINAKAKRRTRLGDLKRESMYDLLDSKLTAEVELAKAIFKSAQINLIRSSATSSAF